MTASKVVLSDLPQVTQIWNDNAPIVSSYLPMPTLTQQQLRNAYVNHPGLTAWVSKNVVDGVRAIMVVHNDVAHPQRDDVTVDFVQGYFIKIRDRLPFDPGDPVLAERLRSTLVELGLAIITDAQSRGTPFIYAWYPTNGHQAMINLLRRLENFNGVRERGGNPARIEYVLSPTQFLNGLNGLGPA